jgi:PAS domain S-box-containing protein
MIVGYDTAARGVEIPEQSLVDFVFENAARYPQKPAISDGMTGRTLTYGQLVEGVRRTAAALAARGFSKGDVLALYTPNIPEYPIVFFAVAMLGGITTTVNPLYTMTELTHQLRDSDARFLISASHLLESAIRAAEKADISEIFSFGNDDRATPFSSLLNGNSSPIRVECNPRRDVVALPYSSGTTGLPKGVMLTHFNIVANVRQLEAIEQMDPEEVLIGTVPFYHGYGIIMIMSLALRSGARIVTMPRFEIKSFLEILEKYRVTTAYVVPPVVRTLAKHPLVDNYDLSSLRIVVSAAAPLPEPIARACAERHHCSVRQAYGLTECGFTHLAARTDSRLNSVGLPLPGTDLQVMDVGLKHEVAVGELGEVWVRGPQMMRGYLNNPETTNSMVDLAGWAHTGDIGYVDKDGYLYVVERAKDFTKFRGLQYEENELVLGMVEEIRTRRQAADRVNFQALLLDSVRESIVATDLQQRITFWNKGAEALFGYKAEDVIGKSLDDTIIPARQEVQQQRKCELSEVRKHGKWNGQVLRTRKDGSELWTDLVASMITDSHGQSSGFVAIQYDVTEQKGAEERLRFQAQLLDSVRESVVAIDLDGRVVFWGRGAEALFGYHPHEVLGHSMASLILPVGTDEPSHLRYMRDQMLEAGMWSDQVVRRRKDGSEFFADIAVAPVRAVEGQPIGLIAIHRDITELRRHEATIRDSREQMRSLAGKLMLIREHERSAIARELHDELGQSLTRLNIDIRWLTQKLPKYLDTKRVRYMDSLVDEMLGTVQHISSQLRPAILDDLGLEAALEWHAQEFSDWSGCRCRLDLKLGKLKPHRERDTAVFRIVQEALTNVARHAHAKLVVLRGRVTRHELALEIEDNGVGLDVGRPRDVHSLGLLGMQERAESVGGRLAIRPRRQHGTIVKVRVPFEASPDLIHHHDSTLDR